eukprot:3508235-Amphidinium_carterae.1
MAHLFKPHAFWGLATSDVNGKCHASPIQTHFAVGQVQQTSKHQWKANVELMYPPATGRNESLCAALNLVVEKTNYQGTSCVCKLANCYYENVTL